MVNYGAKSANNDLFLWGRLEVDRLGGNGSCSYTDPQSFESSSGLRISLMCILRSSSFEHMKSTEMVECISSRHQ